MSSFNIKGFFFRKCGKVIYVCGSVFFRCKLIFCFVFLVAGQIKTLAVLDVESKPFYWLTVYAQDHGVVPLHSRLEVSIA